MSEAKKPTKERLSPKRAREMLSEFAIGSEPRETIARAYGVSVATLKRRAEAAGIEYGSQRAELARQVSEHAQKEIAKSLDVTAARVAEVTEKQFSVNNQLAKLGLTLVAEARQRKAPLASIAADLKALKTMVEVFEMTTRGQRHALGMDDDSGVEDIEELVVKELTPGDIKEFQAQMRLPESEPDLVDTEGLQAPDMTPDVGDA